MRSIPSAEAQFGTWSGYHAIPEGHLKTQVLTPKCQRPMVLVLRGVARRMIGESHAEGRLSGLEMLKEAIVVNLDESDAPRPAGAEPAGPGLQQQGNCGTAQHQPADGKAAPAHAILAGRNP